MACTFLQLNRRQSTCDEHLYEFHPAHICYTTLWKSKHQNARQNAVSITTPHHRLKTFLFKSFHPRPSFSSGLTPRIPRAVYRYSWAYPFFYFLVFMFFNSVVDGTSVTSRTCGRLSCWWQFPFARYWLKTLKHNSVSQFPYCIYAQPSFVTSSLRHDIKVACRRIAITTPYFIRFILPSARAEFIALFTHSAKAIRYSNQNIY